MAAVATTTCACLWAPNSGSDKNMLNTKLLATLVPLLIAALMAMAPAAAAQVPGLTAQEQALLERLPPRQREAALQRLREQQPGRDDALEPPADSETVVVPPPAAAPVRPADAFAPRDSLLVLPAVPGDASDADLEELAERIAARNPYRLDNNGVLYLPGGGGIPLAGLDENLADKRLEADPYLRGLSVEVYRLPVEDFGIDALEPYGYEVFKRGRGARGDTLMPVPSDYTVGPGDTLRVQLFGNQSAFYTLSVDREGAINFPDLGPITVAGLSFDAARQEIVERVRARMIGTEVSVTLGELRSIQVFLAGDVENPGSYLVRAPATIVDVLAAGGGIATSGSLRRIQLRRNQGTVATLDLYQLLLFGDASANRRVASGDVIFVPPVGGRVAVAGAVQRPAIYEIRSRLNGDGALLLAGGAKADAYLAGARLERNDPATGMAVESVDLTSPAGRATALRDGDALIVPGETDRVDRAISLIGHVYRPGPYEWRAGLRLSDLLPDRDSLRPNADARYVLIKRRADDAGTIQAVSADLEAIWRRAPGAQDPRLERRDEVYVFSTIEGRDLYLSPILEALRRQSTSADPSPIVRVGGVVKAPGQYPLEPGMTVSDLIRAGGGLAESAYRDTAELSRSSTDGIRPRESELLQVDLAAILAGDALADVPLAPFDYLNIKQITRWEEEAIVEIVGEVAFPGRYPIAKGETLASVLERAGGLADHAFPQGSVFTRELLKEREREQLDALAARIESDLASMALSDSAQTEAVTIGRSLLEQIENTEPAGRLVIDLRQVISGDNGRDILLRNGDKLYVPPQAQEVTVIGEVQYSTSHLWEQGVDRDEYIRRSGGVTVRADNKRIYVVRANGEVVASNRSRFFSRSRAFDIRPGDTIVVPLDTDRTKPLVLWSNATQILYNLAIAAAAVNSF